VFRTLIRTGTVSERDFVDDQIYSLADGSEVTRSRFILRKLQIEGHIIPDVMANIGPLASDSLLGQSFLSRLNSWTLDNTRHVFVLPMERLIPLGSGLPNGRTTPRTTARGSPEGLIRSGRMGWARADTPTTPASLARRAV
jgi:hypothetical protein